MSLVPVIQDQTVHLIKMKFDAKYRAEFEALQADLAQAEKALAKAPDKTTDKTPVVESKMSLETETELDRKYRALMAADEIVAKVKASQKVPLQKTVFQTNPTLQR